jgi:hypothetical protein
MEGWIWRVFPAKFFLYPMTTSAATPPSAGALPMSAMGILQSLQRPHFDV